MAAQVSLTAQVIETKLALISRKILEKTSALDDLIRKLDNDIDDATNRVANASNSFQLLPNSQFIESRVREDTPTNGTGSLEFGVASSALIASGSSRRAIYQSALSEGLAALDLYGHAATIAVDQYNQRELPPIIGSVPFQDRRSASTTDEATQVRNLADVPSDAEILELQRGNNEASSTPVIFSVNKEYDVEPASIQESKVVSRRVETAESNTGPLSELFEAGRKVEETKPDGQAQSTDTPFTTGISKISEIFGDSDSEDSGLFLPSEAVRFGQWKQAETVSEYSSVKPSSEAVQESSFDGSSFNSVILSRPQVPVRRRKPKRTKAEASHLLESQKNPDRAESFNQNPSAKANEVNLREGVNPEQLKVSAKAEDTQSNIQKDRSTRASLTGREPFRGLFDDISEDEELSIFSRKVEVKSMLPTKGGLFDDSDSDSEGGLFD